MTDIDDLDPAWQIAFAQAWESWRTGNFGIGAVLVDDDHAVVSVGRNRVAQTERQIATLSGNMLAHAEMNTFAALERFDAEGLTLYTTLEPCLMCAATAMQLRVRAVHFAAEDEFFAGIDALWAEHTLTADRQPHRSGPRSDWLRDVGRFLPLSFTLQHLGGRRSARLGRAHHPHLATVFDDAHASGRLHELRQIPTFRDAAGELRALFEHSA